LTFCHHWKEPTAVGIVPVNIVLGDMGFDEANYVWCQNRSMQLQQFQQDLLTFLFGELVDTIKKR